MLRSNSSRVLFTFCIALVAAACGGDDAGPTEPTPVEPPAPVTLTGTWTGSFEGALISGDDLRVELTQEGTMVTGSWTATVRLPPVPGAPPEVPLGGGVNGTAAETTAELSFLLEGFPDYFPEGCAIDASVTSFGEATLEATWETNTICQPPAVDSGTLTLTRQ